MRDRESGGHFPGDGDDRHREDAEGADPNAAGHPRERSPEGQAAASARSTSVEAPRSEGSTETGTGDPLGSDALEHARRLSRLAEMLDRELPEPYRRDAFRLLAPEVLGSPGTGAEDGASPSGVPGADRPPARGGRVNLAAYSRLLASPGRMLLKALVALHVGTGQLDVEWMTPGEIERFLQERARVRSAYRSNLSSALSGAGHLTDRRRRGRGYEYRLNAAGRELVDRELRVLGA